MSEPKTIPYSRLCGAADEVHSEYERGPGVGGVCGVTPSGKRVLLRQAGERVARRSGFTQSEVDEAVAFLLRLGVIDQ